MYPESLKKVINCFKLFPGVGEKTAERMAISLINFDKEILSNFSDSICNIRDNLRKCERCGNISDSEYCSICMSNVRDSSVLLVVERFKDIALFEKIGSYNGRYHVLGGLISPLDGIGPNDINLQGLLNRVLDEEIAEIILGIKPTVEGETTMQYIFKLLENKKIKISRIATGIPIGTDMEYIDNLTLEMAIDERKKMG